MAPLLGCLAVVVVSPAFAETGGDKQATSPVDFNDDIRPLLSSRCLVCHGPDEAERAAGLRLDTAEGAREDLGGYVIVPGEPDDSELLFRITTDDEDLRMPPAGTGEPFTESEVALIRRWIAEGAEYANHWSYVPPRRPELPEVRDQDWARGPIDRFVLARLESAGLEPSAEADRLTLARRLSLDLIGLPPTWEQARAFAADRSEDAYERYVDRLLADPAFGERWARVWLDLARYADSAGYADDPPRTIWAYRDYVIRSLNENKPFDQFTIEQIAGDLLESPTDEELIATAFHRNTLTNNEGGTNDEEFRNVAVVDRVNTTMAVWMGTTMACAQCHTHKYDPITHDEYFEVFAFFNDTADSDKKDERPILEIWDDERKESRDRIRKRVETLKEQIAALESDGAREETLASVNSDTGAKGVQAEHEKSVEGGDQEASDQERRKRLSDELADAEKRLAALGPTTTVPIMRELPEGDRRETHVQIRGNYAAKGNRVTRGTPSAFHPFPEGFPQDRLGLAHWLVDDANPLTARVTANRHWQQLFGSGIVLTAEEFGSQGDPPSHPDLLDWMAVELRESGWDLKGLIRKIVLSSTYRQSSVVTEEQARADPDNRLLSRGPRFRVSAETVRDQALFAADSLSGKMHGPPVRPPQPSLGLKAAFGSATDWKTSDGADRYRRGLYTMWRRSSPYPSMATFDAPNREVCEIRRGRTNTPLQALVTLNDPVYVEAAIRLAGRMMGESDTAEDRVRAGFRRTVIRDPSAEELDRLVRLYESARERFRDDPERAAALTSVCETLPFPEPSAEVAPADGARGERDAAGDAPEIRVELAAWSLVANVLLNLDELFLKR